LIGIDTAKHTKVFEGGARWFYWIAGLSLVNSTAHAAGSQFSFVVGMGVSQLIDGLAVAAGQSIPQVSIAFRVGALALNALVASGFALLARLALKRNTWPFVLGMVLYALDGLLFLWLRDWLSLGFHVFALVCIYNGYVALQKLHNTKAATPAEPQPVNAAGQRVEPQPIDVRAPGNAAQGEAQGKARQWQAKLKRVTWIISLGIGLPIPLTFLFLIPVKMAENRHGVGIADLIGFALVLLAACCAGAALFGLPWLAYLGLTRSSRPSQMACPHGPIDTSGIPLSSQSGDPVQRCGGNDQGQIPVSDPMSQATVVNCPSPMIQDGGGHLSGIQTADPSTVDRLQYAGFWPRLGAMLLDTVILLPLGLLSLWGSWRYRLFDLYHLLPGCLFGLFYSVYLVQRFGGTPGKLIVGVRIRTVTGDPVGYREAILRYAPEFVLALLMSIATIIALYAMSDAEYHALSFTERGRHVADLAPSWYRPLSILLTVWVWGELIVLLTNRKRRALHDFIAGTVVVRTD
jgi:uncharacterized RDD family membrane protein YckC